jgi:hypothetical protein
MREEDDVNVRLVEGEAVPVIAVLAEELSMIGVENDRGLVLVGAGVERVEQAPELIVLVRERAVVFVDLLVPVVPLRVLDVRVVVAHVVEK